MEESSGHNKRLLKSDHEADPVIHRMTKKMTKKVLRILMDQEQVYLQLNYPAVFPNASF